jgi:hypothetical protein
MPTIDATPSGPNANAYGTLAEAVAYFDSRLNTTAWDGATVADQTRAIIQATGWVDQSDYRGERAVPQQPLKWPREFVYDEDGYELPINVIPREVKHATFEAALDLLGGDQFARTGLEAFDEARVGPLQVKVSKGYRVAKLPQAAQNLLRRWLVSSGISARMTRS